MSIEVLLCCEICDLDARDHPIAAFFPEGIEYPINGSMFHSPDPEHDVPAPWHESLTWQWMKCPWCNQVPFAMDFDTLEEAEDPKFPKQFLTTEGYIRIDESIDTEESESVRSAAKDDESPASETPEPIQEPEPVTEEASVAEEAESKDEIKPVEPPLTTEPQAPYDPSSGECPYCRRPISKKPGHLKRHMLHLCKKIDEEERKALKNLK